MKFVFDNDVKMKLAAIFVVAACLGLAAVAVMDMAGGLFSSKVSRIQILGTSQGLR